MKIKAKILLPLIILTILVASAILISNVFLFSGYVDTSAADSVDAASMVSQDSLMLLTEDAELSARFIAEIDAVRTAVAEQNREEILSLTTGLQNELELDFCTITDATGTVIARTHEPDNFGDSVVTQTNVKSAMDGNRVSGLETGTAVPLAVRSGCPIYDFDGNIVGVISAGYRLDYMDFVDNEKKLTGCETAIFVGDVRVSTTITATDGKRLIGVKADPQVSDTVLKGNRSVGEIVINGRSAFASYYPLTAINGSIVGMLSTAQYTDTATGTIMSFLQSGLLITLLMLALSITVMLFIVSRIVSPIHNMVKTATALAGGDNTVDVTVNTRDEMRSLADAFNNMIDKNNDVFSSITLSANQVTSGSQQIASSSQSLAQGAMDHAAAIEQLSSSMQEISDRTKSNVETAKKAAALADAVKSNAEKGSRQMDEMMTAVKQIHDASQSISKVINTIDDIAFQTNILALNAAVEAARAGTHGKGFAVVAEEVRNLAAKSAEAASNTEDLIANSMEKAEVGVRIASETSTSLMDIVSGINESTSLVMEIAESSEQQSFGISEINTGIEQVAQVVQHNSATAEQSSAAAAEMNDQSLTLQQLVSQFKLKNNGVPGPGLPGSGAREGVNRSSEARRLA